MRSHPPRALPLQAGAAFGAILAGGAEGDKRDGGKALGRTISITGIVAVLLPAAHAGLVA